mgnify:CR=1 FL=1
MGKRSDRRNDDHLRTVLAQEAARIILNQGIEDFRTAKIKAAEHYGVRNYGALPNNREIEAAVAEHNRIFGGDDHTDMLTKLRNLALAVMYDLEVFRPCLVGSVLSGNVTAHSGINLHLFSDSSENVGMELHYRGIRHSSMQRKHRVNRDRTQAFPGYRFFTEDVEVKATVFPESRKTHAPLCPVDGRPMRRAKLRDVEALAYAS